MNEQKRFCILFSTLESPVKWTFVVIQKNGHFCDFFCGSYTTLKESQQSCTIVSSCYESSGSNNMKCNLTVIIYTTIHLQKCAEMDCFCFQGINNNTWGYRIWKWAWSEVQTEELAVAAYVRLQLQNMNDAKARCTI